jgi:hypothetical protein
MAKNSVKDTKDTKDTKKKVVKTEKKDKYADVEKGDAPNKQTAFAKLTFNVQDTKKWLVRYYNGYSEKQKKEKKDDKDSKDSKDSKNKDKKVSKDKDKKDKKKKEEVKDEETKGNEKPKVKILGAHFILTASDQVICLELVNFASNRAPKGTAGLYTITEDNMLDTVRLNKDLNFTFGRFLDMYDMHADYASQLNLKYSTVSDFIDKFASGGGNTQIKLEHRAFNFLMYVMLKSRILLAETAHEMSKYARKTSVDDRAVLHALNTVYVGELLKTVFKKAEDVHCLVRGKKEKELKDSENSDEKLSKDKKKKASKASDDEDDEDDEKDKSGSDDEEDEDEEEDED